MQTILANDVILTPHEIELCGEKRWCWIVSAFDGDAFCDGEPIEVTEVADTYEGLFLS